MVRSIPYTGRPIRLSPKEISRADGDWTVVVRPHPQGWMVGVFSVKEGLPFLGSVSLVEERSEISHAAYNELRMLSKLGLKVPMADASRHRSGPKFDKARAWLNSLDTETPAVKTAALQKQAGEVRFVKDRSGDKSEWGWGPTGPSERVIQQDFEFNPKYLKPLAKVLQASLLAMGHVISAQNEFARVKSAQISPDGALGGKGYIQKIGDIRRQFMNCVEALSSVTDTLYDEIQAPHWNPAKATQSVREREEVKDLMNTVNEIRSDPEGFAEETEENLVEDANAGPKEAEEVVVLKQASFDQGSRRVAARYLERQRKAVQ